MLKNWMRNVEEIIVEAEWLNKIKIKVDKYTIPLPDYIRMIVRLELEERNDK